MTCRCEFVESMGHVVQRPDFESPLTDDEVRQIRAILAGGSQETAGDTLVEDWHGKALHPEPL